MKNLIIILSLLLCTVGHANPLREAKDASLGQRYEEVVTLLSDVLTSNKLELDQQVLAYSNRGSASVLLKEYNLAKQDFEMALKLSPNHALSQYHLGVLAEHVDKNHQAATRWYKRSATNGLPAGQYNYGTALLLGQGTDKDLSEAAKQYEIAAKQGHSKAQNSLGYLYRLGAGVKKNFIHAAYWYKQSADQGNNQAANRLAWLLSTCPIEDICDGKTALEYAIRATEQNLSASNLDTLAAAHARNGNFNDAITSIERISSLSRPAYKKYKKRLTGYRSKVALHISQ
jgi:TPR repeat protein